ncbi:unnamed protein product [Caenorhabditis nigoni]
MSHLRSFQESKPQIYIFWQTMTALTMKVIHTSYFLFMYNDYLAEMVLNTRFLDVFICVICILAIFILLQCLFPFYAYVNRVNRERDKNTLVFPMIDHFYGVMKKTHAMFYFIYVLLILIGVEVSKEKYHSLLSKKAFDLNVYIVHFFLCENRIRLMYLGVTTCDRVA